VETPQRKRPVKIEVSEKFYDQLQDEKFRRNLTIQQIIVRALQRYLAVPESQHRQLEEELQLQGRPIDAEWRVMVRSQIERNRKARGAGARIPLPASALKPSDADQRQLELFTLADEIREYLWEFPVDKARLVKESLKVDLKYYRSARIKERRTKGPVRSKRPAGED
jgi:hypothetical protein